MESTSQGGAFVVGAGNTLRSAPEKVARDPQMVKPYKADQYAAAAQVNELPRPLNRDALNLRKYYPAQARKNGFEGDVVLRLLIDADGSIAKVDVVSDPGEGLGPAAEAQPAARASAPPPLPPPRAAPPRPLPPCASSVSPLSRSGWQTSSLRLP